MDEKEHEQRMKIGRSSHDRACSRTSSASETASEPFSFFLSCVVSVLFDEWLVGYLVPAPPKMNTIDRFKIIDFVDSQPSIPGNCIENQFEFLHSLQ